MQPKETPTRESLVEYCVKIINRGDNYSYVLNYLYRNCPDEKLREEVLAIVDQMHLEGIIGAPQRKSVLFDMNRIMGLILFSGGILMTLLLWDKGFVSTVSFILMGLGILGLSGAIK